MEPGTALGFSLPIGVGLAAIGSGFGLGMAVNGACTAMGRQPQAAGKIQLAMIIGAAMIEALTIYALVVVFILGSKMPGVDVLHPEGAEGEPHANAAVVIDETVNFDEKLAEAGIVVKEDN